MYRAARSEMYNNIRQQSDIYSLGQRMKAMMAKCVWTEEVEKTCVVEIMVYMMTL